MTMVRISNENVSRRRLLASSGAAVALTGVAGCLGADVGDGDDADEDEPSDDDVGGTLRFAQENEPVHIDPIYQPDGASAQIHNRLHRGLYSYDEGIEWEPELADGQPESEQDGQRWIVEIKEEAAFHNGDPVTAEDVQYSYTQPIEEDRGHRAHFTIIDEVEIVDEKTVEINLETPTPVIERPFQAMIGNKEVREEYKTTDERGWRDNVIGNGPFQVVEFDPGGETILERWDDFWGELPHVEELRFTSVEESSTRLTELETEAVDLIEGVPPDLRPTIEASEGNQIADTPGLNYTYVAFNCNEGPTTNPRVREAINLCVDLDTAVENYAVPNADRNYATGVPLIVAEEWGLPMDEYEELAGGGERDIERAQEIFEEENVPDDWSPLLITVPVDQNINVGESIINGLQEAGIDAQFQQLDYATFLETYNTGNEDDFTMYIIGWGGPPIPIDYMYNIFHEELFGTNHGLGYENEELFELLEEMRRTVDEEVSADLADQVIRIILGDTVHMPLFSTREVFAHGDYVRDLQIHARHPLNPRMVTSYSNVWLDQ